MDNKKRIDELRRIQKRKQFLTSKLNVAITSGGVLLLGISFWFISILIAKGWTLGWQKIGEYLTNPTAVLLYSLIAVIGIIIIYFLITKDPKEVK